MISAVFTVAWLGRHQELTAMMAAGISKFRVIRPLLFAAAAVSALGVLNRELVIPRVRDELTRDTKDLGGGAARPLEARYDASTGILIGGEKVALGRQQIIRPSFILMDAKLSRFGKQLAANNAFYVDPLPPDRPAGFVLTDVSSPRQSDQMASLRADEQLIIGTPRDVPWLRAGELFVASGIQFPLLAAGTKWRSYASLPELVRELHNPAADAGADVRVAVHSRIVQFPADCTLVLLGLPVMLSRRSRNVFVSIGICLGLAGLFMAVSLASPAPGGLNMGRPAVAPGAPPPAFVPVAAATSHSLRT